MDYKIVEIEEDEGVSAEHVLITHEDGSFESFPVSETNPRYKRFLLEIEEHKEK